MARIIDSMLAQQRQIFGCEPLLAVVAFLVPDIVAQMTILVWRHAKRAIAMLPSEIRTVWNRVVNPFGSGRLDAVHQIAECQGARWLDI